MSAMLAAEARFYPGYGVASVKFAPPALPNHSIRRDRLHRRLSEATRQQLTVVTAPPGAGKTVLLADWAQGVADSDVVWLTVEEGDNDPFTFWRHIAHSLGFDLEDDRGVCSPLAPEDERWADLVVRLAAVNRPCVFIVDDFHLITDVAIIDAVARLVRQLPRHVRLVLAGQAVPGSAVKRLLLSGRATAISDTDLRFTVEETAALVALAAGKCLPPDQVTRLTEQSEGWAAGIHLAARALNDEPDPSEFIRGFSGAYGPVAGYLEHETLLRESPATVRFLLQASVLERLTPQLCRSVSGRSDAAELLESLAQRNLFLIPVESPGRTYRYHRLFADLLRSRLAFEDPSLTHEAHLDAAICLEQTGDVRSAARQFIEAQAFDRAFTLVFSDLFQPMDGGLFPDVVTLPPADMPEPHRDRDPARTYVCAAALMCSPRIAEAAQVLRRLDVMTADGADRQLWRARVEFLWAVNAERMADVPGVLDHCRAVGQLMGSNAAPRTRASKGRERSERSEPWAEAIDAAILAHVPILAARAHVWLGEPDQAQAILTDRFRGEDRAVAGQPGMLGLIASRQGRLRDAYRFASAALERAEEQGSGNDLRTLDARLALADVLFEHNELDAARGQLEAARAVCRSPDGTPWLWAVEMDLLRLMIAQQRPADALSRLGHLRHLERRQPPAHHFLQKLNQLELECRIALGDLEGTLLVARSLDRTAVPRETLARIDLFAGRPDRALDRLNTDLSPTLGTEIRRLVLLACAEMQRACARRAEDALRRALDLGRSEGYVRPFLEEAAQTMPLLRNVAAARPDPYVAHLVGQAATFAPDSAADSPTGMLEPLTGRERELLSFLPTHLLLREIAGETYVSLNTVKTHLKSIYRKLGAASRSEAVAIARTHGLL
jgi:LuxR family transcriptional regulator, maltose regulon positive regulatory protein